MLTSTPALDLVFRACALPGSQGEIQGLRDIAVRDGRIVAVAPAIEAGGAQVIDLAGRLALPGFVDTHVHLDKACLLGRCPECSTVADAIHAVSALKRDFTVEDIYARGAQVLARAITHGTTRMRTHVEVDPRVGLRGFEAIRQLKRDYGWAIDLSVCVFPQEGLTNDPGTHELLEQALHDGADLIGGCPYVDADPHAQIARLFDLAQAFDVDVDLHLDFDLDPSWNHFDEVCRQTETRNYHGRVAVGHATKLSALAPGAFARAAAQLARSGVAVTVLPATDVYLMGRDATHNAPRGLTSAHALVREGVTCSIATNNVLNPFTPFGDASLLRMANFYAHVAHAGVDAFSTCLDLVTAQPAKLMNLNDYGIAPGNPADIVVLDTDSVVSAIAGLPDVRMGFKAGRQTFARPPARLMHPAYEATS